jgi:hypothetical protein
LLQNVRDQARIEGGKQLAEGLQHNVLNILRETFSDESFHRPVRQAVEVIDEMIAALPPEVRAGAAAGLAPTPAPAGPGGGPMLDPVPPGAPAPAATPAAAAPAAPTPAAPAADPKWVALANQLYAVRAHLVNLEQLRGSLEVRLAELAQMARDGNQLPRELMIELAGQRAVMAVLYAELARDAVKLGDAGQARRLLTIAAQLDPGNRARYEAQLKMFDPSGQLSTGALPVDPYSPSGPPGPPGPLGPPGPPGAGAADQGAQR